MVAFGGIDGRVLECSKGINVRPAKQGYEIMVEVEKDRGLLGNFLRERNQSQIKDCCRGREEPGGTRPALPAPLPPDMGHANGMPRTVPRGD